MIEKIGQYLVYSVLLGCGVFILSFLIFLIFIIWKVLIFGGKV